MSENNYNNIMKKWNSTDITNWYKTRDHIQGGEEKILKILQQTLSKKDSMLDIGIGGGRTTIHFSNLFQNYLGIDIADNYLTFLRKKFPLCKFHIENILTFNTEDIYNFILFSHNGIDCLHNINDYLKVIRKMYDLCSKDGYIAFSSHNILSKKYHIKNAQMLTNVPTHEIYKETCVNTGGISIIYSNPIYILNFLKELHFSKIVVIDRDGNEINLEKPFNIKWTDNKYAWLYFLCKK